MENINSYHEKINLFLLEIKNKHNNKDKINCINIYKNKKKNYLIVLLILILAFILFNAIIYVNDPKIFNNIKKDITNTKTIEAKYDPRLSQICTEKCYQIEIENNYRKNIDINKTIKKYKYFTNINTLCKNNINSKICKEYRASIKVNNNQYLTIYIVNIGLTLLILIIIIILIFNYWKERKCMKRNNLIPKKFNVLNEINIAIENIKLKNKDNNEYFKILSSISNKIYCFEFSKQINCFSNLKFLEIHKLYNIFINAKEEEWVRIDENTILTSKNFDLLTEYLITKSRDTKFPKENEINSLLEILTYLEIYYYNKISNNKISNNKEIIQKFNTLINSFSKYIDSDTNIMTEHPYYFYTKIIVPIKNAFMLVKQQLMNKNTITRFFAWFVVSFIFIYIFTYIFVVYFFNTKIDSTILTTIIISTITLAIFLSNKTDNN